MKMIETIVVGVVVAVFGTLIALYLDRWFLSGKRKRERLEREHGELLGELREVMDFVDDLLEDVERGDSFYHKRDRLQRVWESLKKRIPENENSKLEVAFQNADSALGMGQDGKDYALRMMLNLQAALSGISGRVSREKEK